MAGIKIEGGSGIKISGNRFSNVGVGIEVTNTDFTASDNHFDNVRQPWLVRGGRPRIEGTRITNDPYHRSTGTARRGWRSGGAPLPAQCPECGTIFPSRNYEVNTSRIYSRDNEEVCPNPHCRNEHAKVADGLFDTSREIVEIISAPDITYEMLAALREASEDYLNNRITEEQYVDKVGFVVPKLHPIFKNALVIGATILNLFAGIASIGSYYLAKEQTQLAREQTAIARQQLEQNPNAKTEELLEKIFKKMENGRIKSEIPKQTKEHKGHKQASQAPSASKSPVEMGSINLKPQSKPKSRYTKHRERAQRRLTFHPRHPKCPPGD